MHAEGGNALRPAGCAHQLGGKAIRKCVRNNEQASRWLHPRICWRIRRLTNLTRKTSRGHCQIDRGDCTLEKSAWMGFVHPGCRHSRIPASLDLYCDPIGKTGRQTQPIRTLHREVSKRIEARVLTRASSFLSFNRFSSNLNYGLIRNKKQIGR